MCSLLWDPEENPDWNTSRFSKIVLRISLGKNSVNSFLRYYFNINRTRSRTRSFWPISLEYLFSKMVISLGWSNNNNDPLKINFAGCSESSRAGSNFHTLRAANLFDWTRAQTCCASATHRNSGYSMVIITKQHHTITQRVTGKCSCVVRAMGAARVPWAKFTV